MNGIILHVGEVMANINTIGKELGDYEFDSDQGVYIGQFGRLQPVDPMKRDMWVLFLNDEKRLTFLRMKLNLKL